MVICNVKTALLRENLYLEGDPVIYKSHTGGVNEDSPSQPRSICPLRNSASLIKSGSRPLRSTEARQPWKPVRDATSLGRLLYMPGPSPATKRSPCRRQEVESPG